MRDKNGAVVTTAVTNLDIHDIARSSRTYGVKAYFLVTPLEEQQAVVKRIMGHWQVVGNITPIEPMPSSECELFLGSVMLRPPLRRRRARSRKSG